MTDPIVYVDRSEIRAGKLADIKTLMKELAAFVNANEPQLISYAFYLNEDGTHMTVVAVHPDSASLEFHMEFAGEEFRKFAGLINLLSIDVYGEPSDKVRNQLLQKAQMLGRGMVGVHTMHAGFARFSN